MLGKWSFFSVISFHTCAVTVVTKQTRTMNVIETAKRVVFLTAQIQDIYSFGRVFGLGKYPYFWDWTYRFASRLTRLRCGSSNISVIVSSN